MYKTVENNFAGPKQISGFGWKIETCDILPHSYDFSERIDLCAIWKNVVYNVHDFPISEAHCKFID